MHHGPDPGLFVQESTRRNEMEEGESDGAWAPVRRRLTGSRLLASRMSLASRGRDEGAVNEIELVNH